MKTLQAKLKVSNAVEPLQTSGSLSETHLEALRQPKPRSLPQNPCSTAAEVGSPVLSSRVTSRHESKDHAGGQGHSHIVNSHHLLD